MPRSDKPPMFLCQLHKMVRAESDEVIAFGDGKLYINDPSRLEEEILCKYFKHGQHSSFKRQLNYFQFKKFQGKGKMQPCVYVNSQLHGDSPPCAILALQRKVRVRQEPALNQRLPKQDNLSSSQESKLNPSTIVKSEFGTPNSRQSQPAVQPPPSYPCLKSTTAKGTSTPAAIRRPMSTPHTAHTGLPRKRPSEPLPYTSPPAVPQRRHSAPDMQPKYLYPPEVAPSMSLPDSDTPALPVYASGLGPPPWRASTFPDPVDTIPQCQLQVPWATSFLKCSHPKGRCTGPCALEHSPVFAPGPKPVCTHWLQPSMQPTMAGQSNGLAGPVRQGPPQCPPLAGGGQWFREPAHFNLHPPAPEDAELPTENDWLPESFGHIPPDHIPGSPSRIAGSPPPLGGSPPPLWYFPPDALSGQLQVDPADISDLQLALRDFI